jgi:hypothetical protein
MTANIPGQTHLNFDGTFFGKDKRAATAPAAVRRSGALARREGGRAGALQDAGARFGRPRARSVMECGGPPPLYFHKRLLRFQSPLCWFPMI